VRVRRLRLRDASSARAHPLRPRGHPRSASAKHRPRPASALRCKSHPRVEIRNTSRMEGSPSGWPGRKKPPFGRATEECIVHVGITGHTIITEQHGAFRRRRMASSRENHVTAHETVRESAQFGPPLILERRFEGSIHQLPAIAVATPRVACRKRAASPRRIRGDFRKRIAFLVAAASRQDGRSSF